MLYRERKASITSELREIRLAWGLSQMDLAERAGICVTTVYDGERGYARTSIDRLIPWAAALGYEIVLKAIDTGIYGG